MSSSIAIAQAKRQKSLVSLDGRHKIQSDPPFVSVLQVTLASWEFLVLYEMLRY